MRAPPPTPLTPLPPQGDPSAAPYAVENAKQILGKKPVFGICMGHQILGQAFGGKTFKLKFGHHGGNHPIRYVPTGACVHACMSVCMCACMHMSMREGPAALAAVAAVAVWDVVHSRTHACTYACTTCCAGADGLFVCACRWCPLPMLGGWCNAMYCCTAGRIEVSAQNHNFAVDPTTLPAGVEVTHVNLNDGTCAGRGAWGRVGADDDGAGEGRAHTKARKW